MAELIIFPEINPLPMMQKDAGQFFADTIPAHEEQISFCQKAQADDMFPIMFMLPADARYSIVTTGLYGCNGVLAKSLTAVEVTQSVTNLYVFYLIEVSFSGIAADNLYTLRVTLTSDTGPADDEYIFESEPIYLRTSWESTFLLKYTNDINDFDIPFEDMTDFYFYTRVEGGFPSPGFKPESKDQIFIDQNHIPTLLDSIPYNVRQLQCGSATGIPNWQANVINRALSCTEWYVDDYRYCKNEGAKLEPTHSAMYPMSGWVIDVIGLTEYPDTAFTYSKVYVLGSGELAYRGGSGDTMLKAKNTA